LYHCTPKTNPVKGGKKSKKDIDKLASIEQLPPISTKSPKKVNEISKYFKMQKPSQARTSLGRLYTQASISSNNTEDILKIKKAFPSLKVKNINNI